MADILLTNPMHDEATKILGSWIDSTGTYIDSLSSHNVISLIGANVTKANLSSKSDEHKLELIQINGHGNEDILCGHNDIPLIELHPSENKKYEGAIFHALACQAAKNLGGHLIDEGASTFIGYKENFHFYHSSSDPRKTLGDPLATIFLEPAYQVTRSLAEGKTAEESFKASQSMSANYLKAAIAGNVPSNILASIIHNIKNHIILGDSSVSIT